MNNTLYPIVFEPVLKDYMWGGNRISLLFDRPPQSERCAESWEISDRPEGMSVVSNGHLRGQSIHSLVERFGARVVGSAAGSPDRFPFLIKIIDARQRLSVQVHPDDASAPLTGGEAKTEMWYVLGCDENARIFAGLKPGIDKAAFTEAVKTNTVEQAMEVIPAMPGRLVYVPGGLLHAIGEGCIILEVQQNSNTTYRIHDWNRVDRDGKPRETHLEQAMKVIAWDRQQVNEQIPRQLASNDANRAVNILECPYFSINRYELNNEEKFAHSGDTFSVLFVLTGRVIVEANGFAETLTMGTTCLIPAGIQSFVTVPGIPKATMLRITLPLRS